MKHATFERIVTWGTAAVLTVLSGHAMYVRGGPWLGIPDTIESHSRTGQNDTRDVIALCIAARRYMKRGETVTVIRPSQAPHYDATLFLAAVGNLPLHRVVAPGFDASAAQLPEYVLAIREPFSHPAYELYARFAEGILYKRR